MPAMPATRRLETPMPVSRGPSRAPKAWARADLARRMREGSVFIGASPAKQGAGEGEPGPRAQEQHPVAAA